VLYPGFFNTMDPKVYEVFTYANIAKELWNSLYEMYGNINNSFRVFEIQQNLSSLKQESNQPFIEYLGKLKKGWDELRQYRPVSVIASDYVKREEQDKNL
jgi:hypothetical protein